MLLGIVGNVSSVVGIVMLNKYLASVDNFSFMLFLSACHFIFTSIGTRVLLNMGVFEYKRADRMKVLPVALGSLGSVAFMNLNLAYNSVGFYQLSKLACIPVTIAMEKALYGKVVPYNVQLTLIPIMLGVAIATVTEVTMTPTGMVYAILAVTCTTFAQVFTSRFQKDLGCNALQLLYHTAPLISVGMLLMMPFLDNLKDLSNYSWCLPVLLRIFVSCAMALGVNITNYLVLGKTDALTYQVLGHFKTITILILGFVLFSQPFVPKNVMGIAIAMAGVMMYTEVKRNANAGSHSGLPTQSQEQAEAKEVLLQK